VSVIVVGVNHRTAPVDLLERVAVAPSELAKALHALAAREHLAEAGAALARGGADSVEAVTFARAVEMVGQPSAESR